MPWSSRPTAARFFWSTARTALLGVSDQRHAGLAAEHLRDRADQSLVGDHDVVELDPVAAAGRDRDALVQCRGARRTRAPTSSKSFGKLGPWT